MFAYHFYHGQRAGKRALLITACVIAAIRLRGEPIQQSPRWSPPCHTACQNGVAATWAGIEVRGLGGAPARRSTARVSTVEQTRPEDWFNVSYLEFPVWNLVSHLG